MGLFAARSRTLAAGSNGRGESVGAQKWGNDLRDRAADRRGASWSFAGENGGNVLDARPELWKDVAVTDLLTMDFKQYYGESVWAGPQDVWWSEQETYPPSVHPQTDSFRRIRPGNWLPSPWWSRRRRALSCGARFPKLSGLELTKTIELGADGQLKIHETAVNRSDKVVTRDLWLLHRVNTKAPSFLPLKSVSSVNRGFWIAGDVQKFGQITMVQLRPGVTDWGSAAQGKMKAVADAGWMASVGPGRFFSSCVFRPPTKKRLHWIRGRLRSMFPRSPSRWLNWNIMASSRL